MTNNTTATLNNPRGVENKNPTMLMVMMMMQRIKRCNHKYQTTTTNNEATTEC
jgi:hypothetical protein